MTQKKRYVRITFHLHVYILCIRYTYYVCTVKWVLNDECRTSTQLNITLILFMRKEGVLGKDKHLRENFTEGRPSEQIHFWSSFRSKKSEVRGSGFWGGSKTSNFRWSMEDQYWEQLLGGGGRRKQDFFKLFFIFFIIWKIMSSTFLKTQG